MKKSLVLLLVLVLGLTMFPAFAESEYAENISITWMLPSQQKISNAESDPVKKLVEKFNVTVEWIELPPLDQHPEKLNLLLASQQLPDIISWCQKGDAITAGEDGAFIEITPYLDSHFPNVAKMLEEAGSSKYVAYTLEDKLWYIPSVYNSMGPNWGWSFNKEEFEAVGYTADDITTFEGFKAALKALKEKYPDSYPLALEGKDLSVYDIICSFTMPFTKAKHPDNGMMGFDYDTKEFKLAVDVDGYKEALMYMNELYDEGLLDPEFLTTDQDAIIVKFNEKKAFATAAYVGGYSGNGTVQSQIGNVLYPIQWPSPDDQPSIFGSKGSTLEGRGTVLPTSLLEDEEKFERVCAIVDYLYSEEWYDTLYNNPALIDPDGDGAKYIDDYYARTGNVRDELMPWSFYACYQTDLMRVDVQPGSAWADYYATHVNEYYDTRLVDSVVMPFDVDVQIEVNDLMNAVRDHWTANILQFVIGQTDFAEWDSFVAECMRVGGEELCEIYNNFYQEIYG